MLLFLAFANTNEPALWAVVIGWVMSVTLHEFAHGLVAHFGGDYTIEERGGLTLNPLQYVDPMMSIALPLLFLLMGGVPLPGGVTYVRDDLLRNNFWKSAVSAAGPLMNLILFGLLAIPLLPSVGWLPANPAEWSTVHKFVAAMCYLELLSVLLNLIPIPPLDGFGIIAPYLNPELRIKLTTPPLNSILFMGYFLILWQIPGFIIMLYRVMHKIMGDDLFERTFDGMRLVFWR